MISENKKKQKNWKSKLYKIKEIEKKGCQRKIYYKTNKHTFNFQKFQTISSFGKNFYNGAITTKEANEDQGDLMVEIFNFRKQVKPKNSEKKQQKKMFLKTYIIFLKLEKEFLMLLIAKYLQ